MAKVSYTNLTTEQANAVTSQLNTYFDAGEQVCILNAIDAALREATTSARGTVRKGAAVTSASAAIPAAAPAGGTGASAGGWDTAANRDAAIATINGLRTAVSELQTQLNDLLSKLRTAGVVTN